MAGMGSVATAAEDVGKWQECWTEYRPPQIQYPSPERVAEIKEKTDLLAKETAKVCGIGDWLLEARKVLTPEERKEVQKFWDTQTDDMCWADAFRKWLYHR